MPRKPKTNTATPATEADKDKWLTDGDAQVDVMPKAEKASRRKRKPKKDDKAKGNTAEATTETESENTMSTSNKSIRAAKGKKKATKAASKPRAAKKEAVERTNTKRERVLKTGEVKDLRETSNMAAIAKLFGKGSKISDIIADIEMGTSEFVPPRSDAYEKDKAGFIMGYVAHGVKNGHLIEA